jgi:hypothetical protein
VIFVGATQGNIPGDSPLWNEFCDKRGIPGFINNVWNVTYYSLNKPTFILA